MIKIYGMDSCPDCQNIKEQIKGKENEYIYIDIGKNVKYLKEFLYLRDNNKAFDEIKNKNQIGIPCFVLENGLVSLSPLDASLKQDDSLFCSLEDHRNGKKGC